MRLSGQSTWLQRPRAGDCHGAFEGGSNAPHWTFVFGNRDQKLAIGSLGLYTSHFVNMARIPARLTPGTRMFERITLIL